MAETKFSKGALRAEGSNGSRCAPKIQLILMIVLEHRVVQKATYGAPKDSASPRAPALCCTAAWCCVCGAVLTVLCCNAVLSSTLYCVVRTVPEHCNVSKCCSNVNKC